MNLSNSSSTPSGMGLRCKDGDMAVIVGDVPGCEDNIGCIVQVRGPTIKLSGYICWRIKPLDNRKILIREFNGVIVSEKVFGIPESDIQTVSYCPYVHLKMAKRLKQATI